jgi:hypothetical protein
VCVQCAGDTCRLSEWMLGQLGPNWPSVILAAHRTVKLSAVHLVSVKTRQPADSSNLADDQRYHG